MVMKQRKTVRMTVLAFYGMNAGQKATRTLTESFPILLEKSILKFGMQKQLPTAVSAAVRSLPSLSLSAVLSMILYTILK